MLADTLSPPLHTWAPAFTSTDGDIAADIGELVGMTPDADQRHLLDLIFAHDLHDEPVCFEVAIVAPRQNIKTSTLEIAALTDLFVLDVPKHVWTAHVFDTARESFIHLRDLIDGVDDLRRLCRKPQQANGNMALRRLNGHGIEFKARANGGGRGLAGKRLTLDEWLFGRDTDVGSFLPIMAAQPGAQVRYASSAGKLRSTALRSLRDRGRAGNDPRFGYVEFGADRAPCLRTDCRHHVGADGCALDREDLWAQANPALGRRITLDKLRSFRRSMPPAEFAREFLSWWEDPVGEADAKIAKTAWSDLRDLDSKIVGRPTAWVLDVTPDQSRASVGTVGRRADGLAHVELVRNAPGTGWVVDHLDGVTKRSGLRVVHLDGSGPARSLVSQLEARGIEVVMVSAADLAAACGGLVSGVAQKTFRHIDHDELTAALAGASTRPLGDGGWAWARRSSTADISPLVALTIALHVHASSRPGSVNLW